MATDKEYMSFILEQLSEIDGITCRQMMGEYIIYLKDKIAAYVCDNRLLIKPTSSSLRLMENASFEPPYEGAKDMILCDRVDDREFLKLRLCTMNCLAKKSKRTVRKDNIQNGAYNRN